MSGGPTQPVRAAVRRTSLCMCEVKLCMDVHARWTAAHTCWAAGACMLAHHLRGPVRLSPTPGPGHQGGKVGDRLPRRPTFLFCHWLDELVCFSFSFVLFLLLSLHGLISTSVWHFWNSFHKNEYLCISVLMPILFCIVHASYVIFVFSESISWTHILVLFPYFFLSNLWRVEIKTQVDSISNYIHTCLYSIVRMFLYSEICL